MLLAMLPATVYNLIRTRAFCALRTDTVESLFDFAINFVCFSPDSGTRLAFARLCGGDTAALRLALFKPHMYIARSPLVALCATSTKKSECYSPLDL